MGLEGYLEEGESSVWQLSCYPPTPPGCVLTSFSSPYSVAKFALDSFFGTPQRELDVQDVNTAITTCALGLQDRASAKEGQEPGFTGSTQPQPQSTSSTPVPRGVTRTKAALGPKAALGCDWGGAMRISHVFYPWHFHVLCFLQAWLPHPRAWFIRQELNVTATAAA